MTRTEWRGALAAVSCVVAASLSRLLLTPDQNSSLLLSFFFLSRQNSGKKNAMIGYFPSGPSDVSLVMPERRLKLSEPWKRRSVWQILCFIQLLETDYRSSMR